jgi:hypothetical protein
MSYCDKDEDVQRFYGQSYTWVGFDELTHWATPYVFDTLRSRVRTVEGTGLEKSLAVRATTNPGGPGHSWVKKKFIDPAPPNTAFWARDDDSGEVMTDLKGQPLFKRKFIPALLSDNPSLYNMGDYERFLSSLPERKRKQLLEGDWTVADGAAFSEFNKNIHVVPTTTVPRDWVKFRAMDYGYSSYTACLWFAINPSNNQLVVYRELYVTNHTGEELAPIIRSLEADERVHYGILDSSVWHKRGEGPSTAEVMMQKRVTWRPSDRTAGSRINGKNRLHELLRVNELTEEPGIVIMDCCRQLISDLPSIPSDPKGGDDIDQRFKSDHTYDALRYGIMSRPRAKDWSEAPQQRFSPANVTFGY